MSDGGKVFANDTCTVTVVLERDLQGDLRPVDAPLFPKAKDEAWWLVVGDSSSNSLLAIKRIALGMKQKVKLEVPVPETAGPHELTLYLMSDSYAGADQEYAIELDVMEDDEDEDEDDEDGRQQTRGAEMETD